MIKTLRVICILLFLNVLSSCNYRWVDATTTDGKKVRVKEYSSTKVARRKWIEAIFKRNPQIQSFPKYQGAISSDTEGSETYVQFDSDRVYLPKSIVIYKSIFTSGLVSPHMINCARDSLCRRIQFMNFYPIDSPGNRIVNDTQTDKKTGLWSYNIGIESIEMISYPPNKSTRKRFKLEIADNGGMDILLLELTNTKAKRSTNLEIFIKGSHVTQLKMGWQEI